MKLEAVDKRSPGLIRVATVEEVETHRIKVALFIWVAHLCDFIKPWLICLTSHFAVDVSGSDVFILNVSLMTSLRLFLLSQVHYDGWSHIYDEWMDSDHPDIHPAGWCEATGHPLKVPPRDAKSQQPHGNNRNLWLCVASKASLFLSSAVSFQISPLFTFFVF